MNTILSKKELIKISDYLWEIPQNYRNDMRVSARIYASEKILSDILQDQSLWQLVNVATLPDIQKYALAMPDIHEGYGFPIGGIAATLYPKGVISPGGIGYDINCGVRLLKSNLDFEEAQNHFKKIADKLYNEIPSGVGIGGRFKLNFQDLDKFLERGAQWAVEEGYGEKEDLDRIESRGSLLEANPKCISDHAKKRGRSQLGTLGAGNHFLEIGKVEKIFHKSQAKKFGLRLNQVTVMVHSGSRGLGHQVATDYIRIMNKAMSNYKIKVSDRELVCVPFNSPEGQDYFAAMSAAANFAWANRQMISWGIRKIFKKIFGHTGHLELLYDVAHNIAKIEEHNLDSKFQIPNNKPQTNLETQIQNSRLTKLVVHRKGATRAFPKQPVIIPGSMGTVSYVMVGTTKAMQESFGSVCHGAGRIMSRHGAMRMVNVGNLKRELLQKNIIVKTKTERGLTEEAPIAYKDITEVVEVVQQAGLAEKVAKLKPLVVIKG